MDLSSSTYMSSVLLLLYFNATLAINSIFSEILHRTKGRRKILLSLPLIIIVLMLLPVPAVHSANSFYHERFSKSFLTAPFNPGICMIYEAGNCISSSYVVWTFAYHLTLAPFQLLGTHGVKLFNSFFIVLAGLFLYFFIERTENSPLFILAALVPPLLVFLSTATLELLSFSIGIILMCFFMNFLETKKGLFPTIALGVYFMHIRPENFIYLFMLLPYLAKSLIRDWRSLSLLLINLVLKVTEYLRGVSIEWTLNLGYRADVLLQYFIRNVKFIANPLTFNFIFFLLVILGGYYAIKERKYFLAVLPWLLLAIYTTKLPGIYFSINYSMSNRYLLAFVPAGILLVLFSLKSRRIPWFLALLSILPFFYLNLSPSLETVMLQDATMLTNNITEFSNSRNMTVLSLFPWIFENATRSAWYADEFRYSSGDYLAISPYLFFIETHKSSCEINFIKNMGDLELYNFSCQNPYT